jgi:hypothetical protein
MADDPQMSRWDDGRFVGSGFAQSMLLTGRPQLSRGPGVRRPATRVAGPYRDQELPGSVTVWLGEWGVFEVRWQHGRTRARVSLESVGATLHSITLKARWPEESDGEPEIWARGAQRIRSRLERLPTDRWLINIEQRMIDGGALESVFVDPQLSLGGSVRRKPGRTVPLIALAVIGEHQRDIQRERHRRIKVRDI